MKARKYDYLLVLQGHYGQGWEDLCAEYKHSATDKHGNAWKRINANKKDYDLNEGGRYRIISRRELKEIEQ